LQDDLVDDLEFGAGAPVIITIFVGRMEGLLGDQIILPDGLLKLRNRQL